MNSTKYIGMDVHKEATTIAVMTVVVETTIADRPPHRSVYAQLS